MKNSDIKVVVAGTALFNEGDRADKMFILEKGRVSIRKKKQGGFVEVAEIAARNLVGEISFFDRQPRSATAFALTELHVIEIEFESLEKAYKKVPAYFRTMFEVLTYRLRRADNVIRRLQKDANIDDIDEYERENLDDEIIKKLEEEEDAMAVLRVLTSSDDENQ